MPDISYCCSCYELAVQKHGFPATVYNIRVLCFGCVTVITLWLTISELGLIIIHNIVSHNKIASANVGKFMTIINSS